MAKAARLHGEAVPSDQMYAARRSHVGILPYLAHAEMLRRLART
jgi:hypothetical protein